MQTEHRKKRANQTTHTIIWWDKCISSNLNTVCCHCSNFFIIRSFIHCLFYSLKRSRYSITFNVFSFFSSQKYDIVVELKRFMIVQKETTKSKLKSQWSREKKSEESTEMEPPRRFSSSPKNAMEWMIWKIIVLFPLKLKQPYQSNVRTVECIAKTTKYHKRPMLH